MERPDRIKMEASDAEPPPVPNPAPGRERHLWIFAGLAILALTVAVVFISQYFLYGGARTTVAYVSFVMVFAAASAVHLIILARIPRSLHDRSLVFWVVGVGFVLRASFFFSNPIMEDDFYRYLWDGGVLANEMNPYTFAPAAAFAEEHSPAPDAYRRLARASGHVIGRINHPDLTTCYPPVAIGIFAAAHFIGPWSLTAWRAVLLVFDIATLLLLLAVLRQVGKSSLYVAIYWWCPLVIKEGFNSAHMDLAILPFVIAALWLGLRPVRAWHSFAAAGLLGIAVGIKLWPVLLGPLLFRPILKAPRVFFLSALIFAGILGIELLVFIPALNSTTNSGLLAYSERWELNDALFVAILWTIRQVPIVANHAEFYARVAVALILASVVAGASWRKYAMRSSQWRAALWVIGAAFLLSPAQFPWYYLWVVPFLAVTPSPPLLLLTALLPLYYLRFFLRAHGNVQIFDHGVVWLEYSPVWILLMVEWIRANRRRRKNFGARIPCETATASL